MEDENEELLKWCREICYSKPYSKYMIKINDLNHSLLDGKALLAIVHSKLPMHTRHRFIEIDYHIFQPAEKRFEVAFIAAK